MDDHVKLMAYKSIMTQESAFGVELREYKLLHIASLLVSSLAVTRCTARATDIPFHSETRALCSQAISVRVDGIILRFLNAENMKQRNVDT
jgi:hypothetical protein